MRADEVTGQAQGQTLKHLNTIGDRMQAS